MTEAPPTEIAELNLLREWREPVSTGRVLRNALGSLAIHAAFIAAVLLTPDVKSPIQVTPSVDIAIKKATPIYFPRSFEPTQKDENKGKVTRGLDLRSATEGQPSPARRFRPPSLTPGIPAPAPAGSPSLEPPKIEVASGAPMAPVAGIGAPSAGPPPPPDRPKLALESVTGGTSPKPNPNPNVKLELPKNVPDLS